jgi:succinyl-diaminopimelate desuccinylase
VVELNGVNGRFGEVPDVVALTQHLVQLRTVNDGTSESVEGPVARYLAALMTSFGWSVDVHEVEDGRPNVVAVLDGGGGPGLTLMFEGHTDVVTEGARELWSVDPYAGSIVDGRLYGRGSADMKSGLAAMICATRRMQLDGPFPGRIVIGALADEEGLMLGAKHFASTPLASQIDAAIVCEPEAGEMCTSAKGAIRLRIELTGAMAHGAMPHQAKNPIPLIGAILRGAADLEYRLQQTHGEHPHLGQVYLTPTVTDAGDASQINVIPGNAVMCFDVRTIPGVDHGRLFRSFEEIVISATESTGVSGAVIVVDDRPCVTIADDHPVVAALSAAHHGVTGEPARIGGVPGATDGTILWRDARIPNVVYGPGGKWIAHQADEFVEVREIRQSLDVYLEAARRYLGAPR